jgi:hypothetical protein
MMGLERTPFSGLRIALALAVPVSPLLRYTTSTAMNLHAAAHHVAGNLA